MKLSRVMLFCLLIPISFQSASAWWWNSSAKSIEDVCQKAVAAGKQVDQTKKSTKESMQMYVRLLRTIDIRSCPTDFQTAFLDYLHASDAFIPYYSKYEGVTGMTVGVWELLTTMHDKSSEEGSNLIKDLQAKKAALENIANKHGAKILSLPPDDISQKAYLSR